MRIIGSLDLPQLAREAEPGINLIFDDTDYAIEPVRVPQDGPEFDKSEDQHEQTVQPVRPARPSQLVHSSGVGSHGLAPPDRDGQRTARLAEHLY